jgi:peptide-methionine (R)-S-oxide reductase
MKRRLALLAVVLLGAVATRTLVFRTSAQEAFARPRKVMKTDDQWRRMLSREAYLVTRHKETEAPFTGKYATSHANGIYTCVCCGAELFDSKAKFNSGTGWPSFWRPIDAKRIDSALDYKLGDPRREVMCMDCGAHLGHVFDDGPPPTGLRFCINSVSLKFKPRTVAKTESDPVTKKTAKTTAKAKSSAKAKSDAKGQDEPATKSDEPAPESKP